MARFLVVHAAGGGRACRPPCATEASSGMLVLGPRTCAYRRVGPGRAHRPRRTGSRHHARSATPAPEEERDEGEAEREIEMRVRTQKIMWVGIF